jgi:hypothetical protein
MRSRADKKWQGSMVFSEEKATPALRNMSGSEAPAQEVKVFCFFFSKKKSLPLSL